MGERPEGLRARQKRETRQLISDVATRLFLERGYDNVTIADVASAAGVARMTVTNHFPLKEDLVLDLQEELVNGMARAVSRRAPGESALDAVRRDYGERLSRRDPAIPDADAGWQRMVLGTPVLRARLRQLFDQAEAELAAVLARETGDTGLAPRLVAAALADVERLLFEEGQRLVLDGEESEHIFAALAGTARQAYDLLEPAVGDYARR
ncbi:transcriptional regulator, TetR family [Nonomuraea pusilla]|uniref:Transcriptional regulator, TetR family n=1 Tax=Nonomuraea pusilla TaxID=46177 RepID=A0A1H7WZI9_9ACTN|nr:transcriptional regulator, TetR family [Nonomuraea pusilla]